MKIAVLLTTYNRRQKTLACLERLMRQRLPANISLEIFLTDDASADGTAQAIKTYFPQVHLYNGTGSLYWAGGMRHTWKQALRYIPDYFLLLNDDTLLNNNAISVLLNCSFNNGGHPAICIGSTVDEATGKISYGGRKLSSKKRWKSYMVHSHTEYVTCDFGNANIMLVPAKVVDEIGILSEAYTHSLADYDYTLTAKKAGIAVLAAPGFLGACTDDHGRNWKTGKTPLRERIKYMMSPKGLAYSEYLLFIRSHFPLSYPAAFIKLWMKTFFPFIWNTFKK